jgi:hypothetical protein
VREGVRRGRASTIAPLSGVTNDCKTRYDAKQGAVRDPDGMPIALQDLPPPDTLRWNIRRKAEVVAGVRVGLISLDEACQRYTLSVEEFLSWQRLIERHGLPGLRATRLQDYRDSSD